MLCGRGNSFSIISTLKLKVLSKKAIKKKYVCDVWEKKQAPLEPKIQRVWFKSLTPL